MKLFLLDGHALIFKMYYAFLGRPMVNSKGVDTSILFGFTKYLLELVERESPTHVAVSFDPPGGTFRHALYPEYKANRAETPQLVIDALEPLTAILGALRIPVLMVPGFEADDVVGTMALRAAAAGFDVYMVTPDKDYGQLVGPHVYQYRPGKGGGDNELCGPAEICAKWGIASPAQVIDMLAICGDSADNVPGVPGVGPVGAAKLLARYGDVGTVYAHLEELTPRQRQQFEAARGHMALSRELVTIRTDVPLDMSLEQTSLHLACTPEAEAVFAQYEFPSLMRLLRRLAPGEACGETATAAPVPVPVSFSPRGEDGPLQPEETGGRMALLLGDGLLYAAFNGKTHCAAPGQFRRVLEDPDVRKCGADLKAQMRTLSTQYGICLRGGLDDVSLMHYLLNPEADHSPSALARSFLGEAWEPAPREQGELFADAPERRDYVREAVLLFRLGERLAAELDANEKLRHLYDGMEEPLVGVLCRMELAGVKMNPSSLKDFAEDLRKQMFRREREVRELAGDPGLNVASPKQIGELVFEKLKLDPQAKKPRSGNWPTDEQTLQELSGRSPVIEAILDYRGLRKLLNTYIEPLPQCISPQDGRVHTTFNQSLTATGRLSSSNPNLQNIPVRTEQGREIRRAFVAEGPDNWLLSADYSQIELRLMAHFSGDAHLCEAFRSGEDVHKATAAKIFRVPLQEVNENQRRVAKTANFGIMYGISAFGLGQRLGCSRSEAKQIIDDYFHSFPSIREWIDETLARARQDGYVQTLSGRRRYVGDINAGNAYVRSLAERNAVNAPIQGTAADIIKLAMIAVDRGLSAGGLKTRMVLQIHDELLLEAPGNELPAARELLRREMEHVMTLSVPLTVACHEGRNWLEAHP
ncbi:MAG: DNA polymerase I [Bacteroidales bacterium]|nr:DNA polymerase I [Bacteroidales bacterium]